MLYSVQTGCKAVQRKKHSSLLLHRLLQQAGTFLSLSPLWSNGSNNVRHYSFKATKSKLCMQPLQSTPTHEDAGFQLPNAAEFQNHQSFNRGKIVHCCFSKCLLCFSSSIKFPRNEATSLKWKTCQWRRSCHLSHVASSSYHLQMLFTIFSLSLVMFTSSSDSISSICSEWSLFLSLLSIMSCYQWRKSRLEVCSWC